MFIARTIEPEIKKYLFSGKVIILYGARQVGKTTLVNKILSGEKVSKLYLNCDEGDVQKLLSSAYTTPQLKQIIGDSKLIVIDEAQRIKDIGLKLKLMADNFSDRQVIVTGSSSFEIANELNEPLTGRNIQFTLYPLSITEYIEAKSNFSLLQNIEILLIYGSYPQVEEEDNTERKTVFIKQISANYLYKDVFRFQNLKNSEVVQKLLEALALQVGNEVSYTELAGLVGISKQTVASYIDILEKSFVIFKSRPFSRNLRKEIGKLHKIYFYDNGIRNSLINNLNPLNLRTDVGALWENFVIAELKKREYFLANVKTTYFWRTWDKQEIDYVEDYNGKLTAYEIKWKKSRLKAPKAWRVTYPDSQWKVITKENFIEILK